MTVDPKVLEGGPPLADPASPPPFDPLLDPIPDDPVFAAPEPFKGLPDDKTLLATLPEDAKKRVHNVRLGAQRKVEEERVKAKAADDAREAADAARKAAEEEVSQLRTRLKEAQVRPPAPEHSAADDLQDERVARLLGLKEGDWAEGVSIEDPLDALDPDAMVQDVDDETIGDPAKLKGFLAGVVRTVRDAAKKSAATAARTYAQEAAATLARPTLEAQRQATAKAAEERAQAVLTEFRAMPGMDDPKNEAEVMSILDSLDPDGTRLVGIAGFRDGYGLWLARGGAAKLAQRHAEAPAEAPAASDASSQAPPPPPRTDASDLAAFVALAQKAAQEGSRPAGHGPNGVVPKLPKNLSPTEQAAWIARNPEFAAVVARGDVREIARFME